MGEAGTNGWMDDGKRIYIYFLELPSLCVLTLLLTEITFAQASSEEGEIEREGGGGGLST